MRDDGGGSPISSDGVAPSWIVGVSASCYQKISSGTAHLGSPGKRVVKRVCVRRLCCLWLQLSKLTTAVLVEL